MASNPSLNTFYKGETVEFTVELKNRDQTVLSDGANQTITLTFSDKKCKEDPILTFNASPQIVLADLPQGFWNVTLTETDLTILKENVTYAFAVTSEDLSGVVIAQIVGEFTLLKGPI